MNPTAEELFQEYGYEVNTWYDAIKHDRPKVLNLLCYIPSYMGKYKLLYPNADGLSCLSTGMSFRYSDCSQWMVPLVLPTESND